MSEQTSNNKDIYIFLGLGDPYNPVVIYADSIEKINKHLVDQKVSGDRDTMILYNFNDDSEVLDGPAGPHFFIPQYF